MTTSRKREIILTALQRNGTMRAKDLVGIGISPSYLAELAQRGVIAKPGRGMFSLPEYDTTENHSLVQVAAYSKVPVICLLSALQFHHIGTQMPHVVWIAIPYGTWALRIPGIQTEIVRMSLGSISVGVDTHVLEGVLVKIFSPAKTVADCFKYRSAVGIDVAIEALTDGLAKNRFTPADLYEVGVADRVWKVMEPYVEAVS